MTNIKKVRAKIDTGFKVNNGCGSALRQWEYTGN